MHNTKEPPPLARGISETVVTPRFNGHASYGGFNPNDIVREAIQTPPSIVLHAPPGWGKSTFAAFSPKPFFYLFGNEAAGIEPLINNGSIPAVPRYVPPTWSALCESIRWLSLQHDFEVDTVVFDDLVGFESLAVGYIVDTAFGGRHDEFHKWGRGARLLASHWDDLIQALLLPLHTMKMIIFTCQSKTKQCKNPLGEDYDVWQPAIQYETTMISFESWIDILLFGFFEPVVMRVGDKNCGLGDDTRMLATARRDAYHAKSKYNLPKVIRIPDDPNNPESTWNAFANTLFVTEEPKGDEK